MKSGLKFLALAFVSTCLWGQGNSPTHPRFKLVEIDTFGGPSSVYNVLTRIATNDGTVVGAANTSEDDRNAGDCFDQDTCFVLHAWRWRKGALHDLGVLTDGYSSYTNAVNAGGLIVGQAQGAKTDPLTGLPSLYLAAIWDHGKIKSLGTFGGANSIAIAVTDQNFVMGAAENGVADTTGFVGFDGVSQIRAFGWNGGKIFDLGTLGGTGAFPNDMNNLAQIVGASSTTLTPGPSGAAPVSPFLWEKGKMRNLGNLGGTLGGANAINSCGQVVGQSNLQGDVAGHPFLWEHGKMTDLKTLGGTSATAEWLNDKGEVIGYSQTPGDETIHAFLWKEGKLKDLGTLEGDNASNAFGINVRGQITGQSWFYDGHEVTASHAFLSENGGPMLDLNTLVSNRTNVNLVEADYITDRGWIVARGFIPNGDLHTAILIPERDEAVISTDLASANFIATAQPEDQHAPLTLQMRSIMSRRTFSYYRQGPLRNGWHQLVHVK